MNKDSKMSTKDSINQIFDYLDDWRNLPAYALERRADIFFAVYLKEILEGFFKDKNHYVDLKNAIIIPEFPIKKDDEDNNQSIKVDYAVFVLDEDNKVERLIFVELKTDMQSIVIEQLKKYNENKSISVLIKNIIAIRKASKEKAKYEFLISKLRCLNLIRVKENEDIKKNMTEYEVACSNGIPISVVCIAPKKGESNDVEWITFKDVINTMSKADYVRQRFIKSLEKWVNPPGESKSECCS